ncbi:MAG: MFS transporter [Solirubrobacteraceae bacterium]
MASLRDHHLHHRDAFDPRGENYKWIALSNCTLGVLLATLDASITLIAMPDIFRGIKLDPLIPSNSFYLLWMILGFLVVTSVLVVSLGRLGDMFGRVRIYNLGFVIYTFASLLLTIDWLTGKSGAMFLIVFRVVQGVGAACLLANSAAIITDAFPANQRGMALGINNIVGVSGMFVGLVLGGLLAPISWRLVFLISVPVGLFGTVWAYLKLEELSKPRRARIDWAGNVSFALGLILIMIAVTYGIRPYGSAPTGWGSPRVIALVGAGVLSLVVFGVVESRVHDPMFRLPLFRIRAFTFGTLSTFLSAIARGGLMFMLIIWLQGIWLPQHGYSFTETPLWAGIYMLPLTLGMLLAGPTSGYLSDHFGARPFATGGMIGAAISFVALSLLPTDFSYPLFAAVLFLNGVSMGMFASPNRAAVMNSLPTPDRGAGGGMNQTFQNSAQVLSIGVFFTLMILGLSSSLPHTMASGLIAHGVPAADARRAAGLPPVSILFAAFLGYNPIQHLLGPAVLSHLGVQQHAAVIGRSFFPRLISAPFRTGLHEAFAFAIIACLVAAVASGARGGRPAVVNAEGRAPADPAGPESAGAVPAGAESADAVPAGAVPAGAVPAGAESVGVDGAQPSQAGQPASIIGASISP